MPRSSDSLFHQEWTFIFLAPKGASIATDDSRLLQHLSGRLNGNYISKAHNSLNPKLAPDYILTEFKPKDMVTNNILKTPQDLDKVMKQLAAAHNIDIIRPKGQIPLSELITSLQAQNYKKKYTARFAGVLFGISLASQKSKE